MDNYHPPPAYGVPYDPSATFNQAYHHPSNAQGNEASYDLSSTSGYSIPGLQAQPVSIHPNLAAPFGQFLQQLQDSSLLGLPLPSFPPNPFVAQQPNSNPLTVGEPANASSENDYTPDEELPDHTNGRGPEDLDGHNSKDYRARSESGEISDEQQQQLQDPNGMRRGDNMLHQHSPLKPEHSSELPRFDSTRSTFQSEGTRTSNLNNLAGRATENASAIPGLEANDPSKQEELRNRAIEAVKNFHREGISYSNIIKAHQFTAPELEELKSLFASAKLPIDDAHQQLRQADSLQDKSLTEPFATTSIPQHIPSETGPTPVVNKAISRQEYLAKLQAARSKKPVTVTTASEQAAALPANTSTIQPPLATITSAPSALPITASSAITPAKTELVKQKLEALRKETAAKLSESIQLPKSQSRPTSSGQSSFSSAIFTEEDDFFFNEDKGDETHKRRARRADKYVRTKNRSNEAANMGMLEGIIHDTDPEEGYNSSVADVPSASISLRIAPSTAAQATVEANQPPSTPIPGLFLNPFDAKPSFEHPVLEPQVHPKRTEPSSPAVAITANIQPAPPQPVARPGPFGSTLFSGAPRPVSTSAPGQPFRSNSHPYGQYWQPAQPEKFVINIDDSDGESEDDVDVDRNERTEAETSISQPTAPSTDPGSTLVPLATIGLRTSTTSSTPVLPGTSGTSTPSVAKDELAVEKKKMEMKMALMKAKLKAKLAINRTQTPSTPKRDGPEVAVSQTTVDQTASPQPLSLPSEQSAPSTTPAKKKRQSDGSDEANEWRKKRRAEIQSGLQASEQDLASNMAKIAELQQQLARLQEENIQRQRAREQLAKELEELGVDTEGMSHEEMQKTKDDLECQVGEKQKSTAENPPEATEETSVRASPDESDDGSAEAEAESDATSESADIEDGAQPTAINRTPPKVMFPATTSSDNYEKSTFSSPRPSPNITTTSNVKLTERVSPTSSGEKSEADEDIMSISSDDTETYEPEMVIPPKKAKLDAEDEDESYEPMADLTPSESFSPRPEIIPLNDAKTTVSRDSGEESSEVAIHLAPELQPTSTPLDDTLPTYRPYVPYESPLKIFKAYRYHPEYSKNVSQGYRSWTYSHNINTDKEFCPWETSGGICNDTECEYQHFKDIELSGEKLLVQLGTENPGKTDEEKQKWNVGLRELIRNLRSQRVSNSDVVAASIAEYRRKFRGDDSAVLNL